MTHFHFALLESNCHLLPNYRWVLIKMSSMDQILENYYQWDYSLGCLDCCCCLIELQYCCCLIELQYCCCLIELQYCCCLIELQYCCCLIELQYCCCLIELQNYQNLEVYY